MTSSDHYDVAILGGGLAGLTLARQLLRKRPDTRVLIIEKQEFPVSEAAFKVGESTVEIGAHYLGEEVGLKKHLVDEQLPKFGLRFFFLEGEQTLAEGTEVGGSEFFPAPGYQVDRGRLENFMATEMGSRLRSPATIKHVELQSAENDSASHRITFEHAGSEETVTARWVVDATGRAGFLKRQLNLAEELDHNINAVWFRLEAELHIDDWCQDPAWRARVGKVPRRWLSTNHLVGRGYWVWIIPLASGATSIGIVADPRLHPLSELNRFDKALDWLKIHEPMCAAAIEEHPDSLQDFAAMKRLVRGCRQVFSTDRWALTGEAGVFLDPLYSPGVDYIAIGNSMICRMVQEDLDGQPIDQIVPRLENTFLTLFHNNLLTYQDQYPLFGNPRVMSLKYLWDYAIYWGFPALLYFNGKLSDPAFVQGLGRGLEDMRSMNLQMQRFFRDWDAVDDDAVDATFVDQHEIGVLLQLNAELRERLDDDALRARFARNVELLRDLMSEISERIRRTRSGLAPAGPERAVAEHRLDGVFEALNL